MFERVPSDLGLVRLIGIGVSNIDRSGSTVQELFDDGRAQESRLDTATDAIREKFGKSALHRGVNLSAARQDRRDR